MEIIVIIVIIIAIAIFISDANEKERKREEEAERKRKEEKEKVEREKQYQEKMETLKKSEFFKKVCYWIDDSINNCLHEYVGNKGKVPLLQIHLREHRIFIEIVCYSVGSSKTCEFDFNSLGYRNLTKEEIDVLEDAIIISGKYKKGPARIELNLDYWQPIIDNLKAEYDSQFTDPF